MEKMLVFAPMVRFGIACGDLPRMAMRHPKLFGYIGED